MSIKQNNSNSNDEQYNNFIICLNSIFPSELDHLNFNRINKDKNENYNNKDNNNNNNEIQSLNNDISNNNNNNNYNNKNDDFLPSFILLVMGFFTIITWLINIMHIKSKNKDTRIISISSLILFIIGTSVLLSLSLTQHE